jgi:hypothetical protein
MDAKGPNFRAEARHSPFARHTIKKWPSAFLLSPPKFHLFTCGVNLANDKASDRLL